MIGYDEGETAAQAEKRIERVFQLGFMPFCQLYQPPHSSEPARIYPSEWKQVMRKWARPAAYMPSREEFEETA